MSGISNMNEVIGQRIKILRKEKGKTLQHISHESGLSVGYLSNLERGLNSPTIDQLQKICSVLGVNITSILSDAQNENRSVVIRSGERKLLHQEKGLVKYELLSEGEQDLEGICITMAEGADYEKTNWGHGYDEIGIVIKGKMCIEMLGNEYILEVNDSLYIEKNTLHTFKNASKGECVSCWFYIKNA